MQIFYIKHQRQSWKFFSKIGCWNFPWLLNKRTMVVEESIHVIFYESNNSFQRKDSVDDELGLDDSMGRLQIENRR